MEKKIQQEESKVDQQIIKDLKQLGSETPKYLKLKKQFEIEKEEGWNYQRVLDESDEDFKMIELPVGDQPQELIENKNLYFEEVEVMHADLEKKFEKQKDQDREVEAKFFEENAEAQNYLNVVDGS